MKKFKPFRVSYKKYRLFVYDLYFKGNEVVKAYPTTYKPGDVVYIKAENAVGVVLGCIDEECQDLRTDMSGMQCYSQIEHYNPFEHPLNAFMCPELREELWVKVFKDYILPEIK